MNPIVLAKDLSFHRNDMPVFDGLSFSVDFGQVLHIKGPNGVGKTTLLKLIAGLLAPTQGNVERYYSPEELVYIGHRLGLKELLTVEENLNFHPHPTLRVDLSHQGRGEGDRNSTTVADFLHQGRGEGNENKNNPPLPSRERSTRVENPCRVRGVKSNNLVKDLSAGQRQCVALTRLAFHPAKLWLLDEPLTALDAENISWFSQLLELHCLNGGAAIIASHQELPVKNNLVKTLHLEKVGTVV